MIDTKVIILIGTEGSGKTYTTKSIIKNVNKGAFLIFDVNGEYEDYYPYPFNPSMDKFLEKIPQVKNCVIIVEDATSFFSRRGREEILVQQMTARRHTGNTFIFLFHAFADIPEYILRKSKHIFIFKTLDSDKWMKENYRNTEFYDAWEKVQKECASSKFWSRYPPPPGSIPPSFYLRR